MLGNLPKPTQKRKTWINHALSSIFIYSSPRFKEDKAKGEVSLKVLKIRNWPFLVEIMFHLFFRISFLCLGGLFHLRHLRFNYLFCRSQNRSSQAILAEKSKEKNKWYDAHIVFACGVWR